MSKKGRAAATAEWNKDKKLIDEARGRRGLVIGVDGGDPVGMMMPVTSAVEDDANKESVEESKSWIKHSPCPGLPVLPIGPVVQPHREKDISVWDFADLSCLIAKQISIREALKIPEAKAALDREWKNLWAIKTWGPGQRLRTG